MQPDSVELLVNKNERAERFIDISDQGICEWNFLKFGITFVARPETAANVAIHSSLLGQRGAGLVIMICFESCRRRFS